MGRIRRRKTNRKAWRQKGKIDPSETSHYLLPIILASLGLSISSGTVLFLRGTSKLAWSALVDPQTIVLMLLFLAGAGLIGLLHWTASAAAGAFLCGILQLIAGFGWLELTFAVSLGFLLGIVVPFFWKLLFFPFSFPVRDENWSTRLNDGSGPGDSESGGGGSGGSSGGGGFSGGGGGGFGGGGASGGW